jgi:hypothetical protein
MCYAQFRHIRAQVCSHIGAQIGIDPASLGQSIENNGGGDRAVHDRFAP